MNGLPSDRRDPMPNRPLGRIAVLATLLLATSASGEAEEGKVEELTYARPGFYAGVGGTAGFPMGWDSDADNDLNADATDLANQNADQANPTNPKKQLAPLEIVVDGYGLEDTLLGLNGIIGYRAGQRVAFEVEGEWLVDSNKSNINVTGSTGLGTAKIKDIWTLTGNVRLFLPNDWRVQPSAVFGLGMQQSTLDVDIVTSGITTVTTGAPPVVTVPADFRLQPHQTKLTGAIRVGGGVDFYATPNIVGQLSATYVMPFAEVGPIMTADYMSLVWRLVYRF
jgi:hypothetical protein